MCVKQRRQTCPRSVLTPDPIERWLKGGGTCRPPVVQIKATALRSRNRRLNDTCFLVGKKCHGTHGLRVNNLLEIARATLTFELVELFE